MIDNKGDGHKKVWKFFMNCAIKGGGMFTWPTL